MKVTYLKSATVILESKGVKILTDPWLTDGEYYGSWHHYPQFKFREGYFKDIDYIYVSHIHPDHFSKKTLEQLPQTIPVLIHGYEAKFLKQNIERLGFKVIELPHNQRTELKNGVHINVLAADNCDPSICAKFHGCGVVESKFGSTQIDTLCVIDDGSFYSLNTNDCPFELSEAALDVVKKEYPRIDLLLVGYSGAGPYPQCFKMTKDEKEKAAQQKKIQFLDQGLQFIEMMKPRNVLPFAGTYVLGGRFAKLQKDRGVPEIEEAADYFRKESSSHPHVLLLNSYESFDLATNQFSTPYKPIDPLQKQNYMETILAQRSMDYEKDPTPTSQELVGLLEKAFDRFEKKRIEIDFKTITKVLIKIDSKTWFSVPFDGTKPKVITNDEKSKIPQFVSYEVDPRLLRNVLMGPKYGHWNNAEIGSHIEFERKPNIFERGLYHAMNFFHT